MIRVLIADDSAFMRKVLSDLFSGQSDFEVAGVAFNGKEAIEKVLKLRPDLLTMDVNMPVMDGLQALSVIMKDCPLPVVMFSSLTQEGAEATLKALDLGAVDFISKTGGSISKIDTIEQEILEKCRVAATANISRKTGLSSRNDTIIPVQPSPRKVQSAGPPVMTRIALPERKSLKIKPAAPLPLKPRPVPHAFLVDDRQSSVNVQQAAGQNAVPRKVSEKPVVVTSSWEQTGLSPSAKTMNHPPNAGNPGMSSVESPAVLHHAVVFGGSHAANKLVAIGTSTGGPKALQNVITRLPGNLPCGVVIVQHMPPGFTKSLAERLNTISEISVKEAENHDIIKAGQVYIAPGDYHMVIQKNGNERMILLNQDPPLASHRPAVDVMFNSVAQFGRDIVSVILTGMGCDGAAGMQKIKRAGGYIIAEDQSTSVVYGMPKAVVELGIADRVLPVQEVAGAIVEAVKK